ncbi:MAG: hypothetical protein J0H39_20715 [Alphaproteobacteria bacterium]|nr:hypothetical protein [Alphaproteobacteria bacterium]
MPNYTLAQLRAMQAERRYWDKRDPANADFVAQVDQGYRDLFDEPAALVPTPEQEEQSRRLEEDLRRRMARSEYWNPRHADYQRLHDDVAQGYAKLYPAAAPASPMAEPEQTPPPEPVNLLELTRRMLPVGSSSRMNLQEVKPSSESNLVLSTSGSQIALSPFWQKPPAPEPTVPERSPVPMPPKIIHPDISAPPNSDPNLIYSPLQVDPSQIEKLWKFLDDPEWGYQKFLEEWGNKKWKDPVTGEERPFTEKELRDSFERDQDKTKEFLWDYYHRRDSVFPEDKERAFPPGVEEPNEWFEREDKEFEGRFG